jgi:hypothetical protein
MTRELRREVLLPLVFLMTLLILTSAGTVALLARMAPAIERIIGDNLYSLQAAEEMLAAISEGPSDQTAAGRFTAALDRAERNVTEARERGPLAALRSDGQAALAGDPAARRRVVDALVVLAAINRDAVIRTDEEARRLGYAGAWAAVFLGALSFAWAVPALRRARRRVIAPIQEVGSVLDAAHAGDTYRRCRRVPGPAEIEKIMSGIDDLLDARALRGFAEQPSLRAVADRQILLHLLERRPGPVWVITASGALDAANRAGLDLLAGEGEAELRRRLAEAAAGGETAGIQVEAIEGVDRFLCEAVTPVVDRGIAGA